MRQIGYGARPVLGLWREDVHPSQVNAVHEALTPSLQAQAWAARILEAWQSSKGAGAIQVDGKMVDKPVVLRAQRILDAVGVQS